MRKTPEKIEEIVSQCSTGIQKAVRFFLQHGYETTDSGDGSHFREGMEGAFPYDHVIIDTGAPYRIPQDSERILNLLRSVGANGVSVEASFSPEDWVTVVIVSDPNFTGELRRLPEVLTPWASMTGPTGQNCA